MRLGRIVPVALEAAHIKWRQAGGPDLEVNGLALCSLHHKLFDRGAFTLSNQLVILVSDDAHGYLRLPRMAYALPRPEAQLSAEADLLSERKFHWLARSRGVSR